MDTSDPRRSGFHLFVQFKQHRTFLITFNEIHFEEPNYLELWFIFQKMVSREIRQNLLQNLRRDRIHWSLCSDYSAGSCWTHNSGKDWSCYWFQKSRNPLQSFQSPCSRIRRRIVAEELSLWGWRWRGRGEQRSWWGPEIDMWMSSLWRCQEMTDYEREKLREGNLGRNTKWSAFESTNPHYLRLNC